MVRGFDSVYNDFWTGRFEHFTREELISLCRETLVFLDDYNSVSNEIDVLYDQIEEMQKCIDKLTERLGQGR